MGRLHNSTELLLRSSSPSFGLPRTLCISGLVRLCASCWGGERRAGQGYTPPVIRNAPREARINVMHQSLRLIALPSATEFCPSACAPFWQTEANVVVSRRFAMGRSGPPAHQRAPHVAPAGFHQADHSTNCDLAGWTRQCVSAALRSVLQGMVDPMNWTCESGPGGPLRSMSSPVGKTRSGQAGQRCVNSKMEVSGSNSVVECQLPKLDVAGSTPVSRSIFSTI